MRFICLTHRGVRAYGGSPLQDGGEEIKSRTTDESSGRRHSCSSRFVRICRPPHFRHVRSSIKKKQKTKTGEGDFFF